jgi:hypothetical protein
MFKTTLPLRSHTSAGNSQTYEPSLFDEIGFEVEETGKPWSPVDPPLADVTPLPATELRSFTEVMPTEQPEQHIQVNDAATDMIEDDTVIFDDDEIPEYRNIEEVADTTVELPTTLEVLAESPHSPDPVTFIEEPVFEETATFGDTIPLVEEPVIRASIAEAPIVETPAVEDPIAEAPAAELPIMEAPIMAAPVVEAPIMEARSPVEKVIEPALIPPMIAPTNGRTTVQKQGLAPKKIGSGRLVSARLTWKPRDPFACPSQPKTQRFRWEVMLTSACITAVCGLGCVWILRTLLA